MSINELENKKISLILLLRSLGITSHKVMSAIEKIPREEFVPENLKKYSYQNISLPIGFNQIIIEPYIIALMTEKLNLKFNDKILEIGTGCGYLTAILSKLIRNVYTIEKTYPLLVIAKNNFKKLKLTNIISKYNNGEIGWYQMSPFDNIIITSCLDKIDSNIFKQIKVGGKCLIPLKQDNGKQILKCITIEKNNSNNKIEEICEVQFFPQKSI